MKIHFVLPCILNLSTLLFLEVKMETRVSHLIYTLNIEMCFSCCCIDLINQRDGKFYLPTVERIASKVFPETPLLKP